MLLPIILVMFILGPRSHLNSLFVNGVPHAPRCELDPLQEAGQVARNVGGAALN